jgi:hypothetical protein
MKQVLSIAWLLGLSALGCSGGESSEGGPGSSHLRLEVSCSTSSDCPATFECEAETEHGVATTFCSSIEPISANGGGAMCPSGYEVEVEHGVSFCKPHGGDDHGAGGSDDGASHDLGDDHGAGGSDDSGKSGSDDSGKGKGK